MFKDQLMSAVKDAVQHYNNGADDNTAVVKAASSHDFNKSQAERLVESFNTAKTINFYKQAEDRGLAFGTASKDIVLHALFSDEAVTKQAAAPTEVYIDYGCYDGPGYTPEPSWDKCATNEVPALDLGVTKDTLSREFYTEFNAVKKAASAAADAAEGCKYEYSLTLQKIAQRLADDWNEPTKVAEAIVAFRSSVPQSEVAEAAVDDMMVHLPGYEKSAADKVVITDFDRRYPELVELFKTAAHYSGERVELLTAAELLTKTAEDSHTEFLTTIGTIPPKGAELYDDLFTPEIMKRAAGSPFGAIADPLTKAVATAALTKNTDIIKGMMTPNLKNHKNMVKRVNNKRRQLILEDLMMNDPIISGGDPESVGTIYKSLTELSPDMSLDPSVTRSVLREAVNSVAFSPYDAKSIGDLQLVINKNIKDYGDNSAARNRA